MKELSNKSIRYMDITWGFSQGGEVDDTAMFWDKGLYEMVAKRLVDAGAVEPNCPEAREMIKVAQSISRDEEREMIDIALQGITVYVCRACNYHHFLDLAWLEPNDWIAGGCQGCGTKHTLVHEDEFYAQVNEVQP